jgi:hypothetical protein
MAHQLITNPKENMPINRRPNRGVVLIDERFYKPMVNLGDQVSFEILCTSYLYLWLRHESIPGRIK